MTAAQEAERDLALAGAPSGPTADDVQQVADSLTRLTRSVERTRQRFIAAAQHDVEWSAHLLINTIAACGPVRASALAEKVFSDPSTVSRQIAALVRDGLVERQADPVDGRASLLVLTDRGRQIREDHLRVRDAHFARMLDGWPERDCRRFAALLARFVERYEAYQPTLFAEIDNTRRTPAIHEEES
jgi:DNA-binding MarR family transcriptional regulator